LFWKACKEKQAMDQDWYRAEIHELYKAEVLGEGLASRWLELSCNPDQKYKLALFLQLESEAKVRLRPLIARHGLDVVEDQALRSAGAAVAEKFASMKWQEAMATFADLARPFLERFQTLLNVALPEDAPLVRFMVVHEGSVIRIARREAGGEDCMDHELITMLAYPLVRHHPVA
jgi:hypothetical protein